MNFSEVGTISRRCASSTKKIPPRATNEPRYLGRTNACARTFSRCSEEPFNKQTQRAMIVLPPRGRFLSASRVGEREVGARARWGVNSNVEALLKALETLTGPPDLTSPAGRLPLLGRFAGRIFPGVEGWSVGELRFMVEGGSLLSLFSTRGFVYPPPRGIRRYGQGRKSEIEQGFATRSCQHIAYYF